MGRICHPERGLSLNSSHSRRCDCVTTDCQGRGAFSRFGGSRRPQQRGGPCRLGRTRRPAGAWGPMDRRTPRRASCEHDTLRQASRSGHAGPTMPVPGPPCSGSRSRATRAPPSGWARRASFSVVEAILFEWDRTTVVSRTVTRAAGHPGASQPRPTDDNRGRGILHRTPFRASPQAGHAYPWVTSAPSKHSYVNKYCLRGSRCVPAMLESEV